MIEARKMEIMVMLRQSIVLQHSLELLQTEETVLAKDSSVVTAGVTLWAMEGMVEEMEIKLTCMKGQLGIMPSSKHIDNPNSKELAFDNNLSDFEQNWYKQSSMFKTSNRNANMRPLYQIGYDIPTRNRE